MPPKFMKGGDERKDRVHLLGLDSSDEEEEEIFLNSSPNKPHHSSRGGNNAASARPQDQRIRQVQDQVSGVIDVMKTNIGKVMQRGEKLEDLEEKSEGLAESSTHFRSSSRRLAKKAWWQQFRMKLVLAGIVITIIAIVIIIVVVRTRPSKSD